ncbi:mTERF family protein [Musa troglodytarum]|uniref:mTERF family protein n=1 Tax=Musa troglodytarum TaxID=320322 RepID=A0A9E7I7B0_9LILI|nr:mTERF family protein [Musa troglodytarum]URE46661.1 mTERF family protein [Musa troglodytarum]
MRRSAPYSAAVASCPCSKPAAFEISSSSVDAAAAVGGAKSPDPHFMVEYLVNSCGFSPSEAAKFSKPLAHLRSTEKPDAVLNFMRSQGLDGAGIRKVISSRPNCLCCNVEANLAPRFQFLRDLGLSESDIVDAIQNNSAILGLNIHRSFVPKLEMWERLMGSREHVLRHFKKTTWFFSHSVEKRIHPNLKFLTDECGIPEERVSMIVKSYPHFIAQKPESLRALIARADELGIPRHSQMFMCLLRSLHRVSKETVEANVELLRSFRWSESEFLSAVKQSPNLLSLSPELLRRKMEFLINEVGYVPAVIADNSRLLLHSLEKRVIPRFRVLEMLNTEGLWTRRGKFVYFVKLSNAKFMEKIVLPYKEKVPELLDIMRVAGFRISAYKSNRDDFGS